jgi:peroxiredoxin
MKETLRLAAAVGVVVLAALLFVRLQAGKGYALQPGAAAPDFRLAALAGGEIGLSAYRGRPVLLNFWATWCPPCVDEMPSLQRLHTALAADGLVLLSVSVDEDGATLQRFVSEHGLTFPVLRDPGGRRAANAYRTTGYPETFWIDPAGVIQEVYVGPEEWDSPGALGHFRTLLKPSTSPTR